MISYVLKNDRYEMKVPALTFGAAGFERNDCDDVYFEHYVSEIKEPQLKEDMQKLTAALKNQRSGLLTSLEDNNGN